MSWISLPIQRVYLFRVGRAGSSVAPPNKELPAPSVIIKFGRKMALNSRENVLWLSLGSSHYYHWGLPREMAICFGRLSFAFSFCRSSEIYFCLLYLHSQYTITWFDWLNDCRYCLVKNYTKVNEASNKKWSWGFFSYYWRTKTLEQIGSSSGFMQFSQLCQSWN